MAWLVSRSCPGLYRPFGRSDYTRPKGQRRSKFLISTDDRLPAIDGSGTRIPQRAAVRTGRTRTSVLLVRTAAILHLTRPVTTYFNSASIKGLTCAASIEPP